MKACTKKLLVWLTVFTITASILMTGCSSGSKPADTSKSQPAQSAQSAPAKAPEAKQEPVELVFWTMWDGGDVAVANKMFDEYMKLNPNVKIKFQQQEFTQYATKLKTGIMSGTGPDFAVNYVGGFISGLQSDGLLTPINKLADQVGVKIDYSGYTQKAVETNKVIRDYYAIPCDNLIRVVMYNKTLLKNSGVLDANGKLNYGSNYNEFMATLDKVSKSLPSGVSTLALTMRPPQLVLGWLTVYAQMGGEKFIDLASKSCVFDDKIAVDALKAYRDIYVKYVPPNLAPPADLEMFKAGKAAFYIDGSWNVAVAAQAVGDNFGVTKFPKLFDKDALITTNHAFIIPKNDKRSDAKSKAILEFIKWWGENNWKWSEAGHMPAYMPSTQTAEFKALPFPKNYASTLDVAVPIYTIPGANLHQIKEVTDPIQKGMLGQITCEEAVKTVKNNLNKLIPELSSK